MDTEFRDNIAELLMQTGQAHLKAFAATNGVGPNWSIWYAAYSRDTLAEQFGMDFHKSQLIYCLMNADVEHQEHNAGAAAS